MQGRSMKRSALMQRRVPLERKKKDGPPRKGKNLVCAECGEGFYAMPSDVRGGQRFCSHACRGKSERVREYRRCSICPKSFEVKPSSRRQTCSDECAREARRRGKLGANNPNYLGDEAGKIRWRTQAGTCCAVCGSTHRLQLHHVVYEQHVRSKKGDPWEPANSLALCNGCHCRHHAAPRWKLPVSYLRDENYAFACDLLGLAAYDYLGRYYHDDGDERMYELLEELAA